MNTKNIVDRTYYWIDQTAKDQTLRLARSLSRRSFLSRIGMMLAGVATLPLLPVARSFAQDSLLEVGDEQSCEYWRYCAMGGALCTCCGGTITTCPPGSEASPITWVGTCRNPADGRNYVISYNDCCGKSSCGACLCQRDEGDRPPYRPDKTNDINWCLGTTSATYHCSTAIVVGVAFEGK